MTILEARKTMPWATAASVSREWRHDLLHVRVTLLESPLGRFRRRAGLAMVRSSRLSPITRLDEDLSAAFGQKDVIILK